MTALWWLLRLGPGAMLVVAGVLKLGDPTTFAIEIVNYRMGTAWAPYLAPVLPMVEIVVGIGVVALPGLWRRAAIGCAVVLLAMFTVAVAQVVARGINVSCGCFGGDSGPVGLATVARDVVLLAAATGLYWLDQRMTTAHAEQAPPA